MNPGFARKREEEPRAHKKLAYSLRSSAQAEERESHSGERAGSKRVVVVAALAALTFLLISEAGAAGQPEREHQLTTADQIRRLTPREAEQGMPVHLRGVVTFYDEALYSRFIQDATAGIYLREMTNMPPLIPGQEVSVEGITSPGEYAPVVVPTSVKVTGEAAMPTAQAVSLEELVSGREDSQFVEVNGIVRSVRFEAESQQYLMDLVTGGERFTAYAKQLPVSQTEELLDSTVKVRGVCSTLFNRQRQLFGFRLLVPRPEDLVVEKLAPVNPYDIPTQTLGSLLQFTPHGTFGHRVKVSGVLVYQEPGIALFIQDEQDGLYCQTRQRTPVWPGDRVEILGFPAKGEYTPVLQDAVFRKVGQASVPQPEAVGLDQALSGTEDCRLVKIRARLLERTQRGREQFLVLERDGFIFHAYLGLDADGEALAQLENGSEVSVTGVCLIERGSSWRAGEGWRAKSFRILLRSAQDVAVMQAPPWWTLKKLLWIAGALGLVTLAAFSWIGVLRRRVQKQTDIIRGQLRMEASLKERYLDLFENANDVVFTHGLAAQITSINKTGERLLQRDRKDILSRDLLDLIAEDQRVAARHWLEQVAAGADVPTAEWDFINASGQRIKLEISSRLIEQDGRVVEVEAIARDITERRRLEREILEISNREQRRIGHDLHDGVCQQMAAITFLVDVLGDRLEEKKSAESSEARRIGSLIHETNAQARSVARGLFPVRLEEHGLILALDELVASMGSRYRVMCRFICQAAAFKVDSEVELHLYYIVQEALLNAVNHGKASTVVVTLTPEVDRIKLTVQDNGIGFDSSNKGRGGMGIRIMRYRAKVIGASLDVQSQAMHGTQVTCLFSPAPRESAGTTKNG
jgi:PAS domain S-box-containing protein